MLAFAVFLTVSLRRERGADRAGAGESNLTMFKNFPFFPEAASTQAGQVDALFFFMVAVTAFFSVLIAALVVVFAVKYRRKHDDEVGAAIHGSLALELLWTVIPFGIAMVMFVWGAKVFFDLSRPPATRWRSTSSASSGCGSSSTSDGQREINELHVPVGRPVKLIMTSEDVIHSFFVPAFRVKPDVLPGRYTTIWFEADQAGHATTCSAPSTAARSTRA